MKISVMYFRFVLVFLLIHAVAQAQPMTFNTKKVDEMIRQWNDVHNQRTSDGFENLYDEKILFFAEQVSREKATLLKKLLFVRNPEYRQRISSDVKYTFYKNGLVRCDFAKDVWVNSQWESKPTYLLIGYRNHGYWIVGESETSTDKKLGFAPRMGEPVDVAIVSAASLQSPGLQKEAGVDGGNLGLVKRDTAPFNAIPVFLVVLALGTGGLIMFLRRPVQMATAQPAADATPVMEEDDSVYASADVPEPSRLKDEPYQVIEKQLKQDAFRRMAIRLFNPLSFVPNNDRTTGDIVELDVVGSEPQQRIQVRCLYLEDSGAEIVLDAPANPSVYHLIGIGGPPHAPHELYLLRPNAFTGTSIQKEDLKPFRRSTSTYFDTLDGLIA